MKEHISEMDRRGRKIIPLYYFVLFYCLINTYLQDGKADICLFPILAFIPPLGKEKVVIEPWLADDGKRYTTNYTK